MYIKGNKCINCDKIGHCSKKCKFPILSYGILLYKTTRKDIEFLLVQRKDTIGYIDFIRGNYSNSISCENLIHEMINEEKNKIISNTFDSLWNDLWINHSSKIYRKEYEYSKRKFYSKDILNLVNDIPSKWKTQEFCIPKGRKNIKETDIHCAIREFNEETGYKLEDIEIISPVKQFEEVFIGSDGIYYKHIYYLAKLKSDKIISKEEIKNVYSKGEVRDVKWFDYRQAMNTFRNYENSKRSLIYSANKYIREKLEFNI